MRLSNLRRTAAIIGLSLMAGTLSGPAFAAVHSMANKEVWSLGLKPDPTSNNYSPTIKWTLDNKHAQVGTLTKVEQENEDKFQKGLILKADCGDGHGGCVNNSLELNNHDKDSEMPQARRFHSRQRARNSIQRRRGQPHYSLPPQYFQQRPRVIYYTPSGPTIDPPREHF